MSEYRKELFDNLSDIVVVKKGGRILDANRSFFKFFTNMKNLENIKGKSLSICRFFKKEKGFIYHVDDAKWIEFAKKYPNHTHKAKIQRGNNTFIFKLEVIENSGSTIILLKNISDVQTCKDSISQINQMFEESESKFNQYKKALNKNSLITISDADGKITEVSRNFLEMTSYTKEEVIGKDHTILKDESMPESIYKDIEETVKSKGTWQGVTKNLKKDKSSFYANSSITPILDKNQNIIEYLSIRQDITNLILSQNLTKKATNEKYLFLSNMSSILKHPLSDVGDIISRLKSSANLSMQDLIDLEKADETNTTSSEIINDISDFSNYSNGDIKIEPIEGKISETLENLMRRCKEQASEKKISLNFNLDPDLPNLIKSDFVKIERVLYNFITNGIKFTNRGGRVDLNVEVMKTDKDSCNINFEVKDNGIGIKEEHLDKIFKPFIQVKQPIIKDYQGTGLGLAISKEIIELFDTKIEIKSQENRGTIFSFELNFEIPTSGTSSTQKTTKEVTVTQGVGRVLVVDDNMVNRKLMEILLKKRDLYCELAVDGKEALEKATTNKFDLVLMDIQMPVMGGIESMQKIQAYEKQNGIEPKTALVSLSGNVSREDSKSYMAAGFNDCLTKPLREPDLDIKLKKYITLQTTVQQVEVQEKQEKGLNRFELVAQELELDMDFLQDLMEMFFSDNKGERAKFAFAIETIDFKSIKYHAHKIKGSSLNLKLDEIAFIAAELELGAKNRELIDYDKKFQKLITIIDKIEEDFNSI